MAPIKSYAWGVDDVTIANKIDELGLEIRRLSDLQKQTAYSRSRVPVLEEALGWLTKAGSIYTLADLQAESAANQALELVRDVYGSADPETEEGDDERWMEDRIRSSHLTSILKTVMKRERDRIDRADSDYPDENQDERLARRRESRFWAWIRGQRWNV